jgi:predicted nucleic acid-binding protein
LQLIDVLRELYSTILITPEVALEFGDVLPDFIRISKSADPQKQRILSVLLDSGEAASIALAFEIPNALLILDDLKARKEAAKLGFRVTGTLGILTRAKKRGLIKQIAPYLSELQNSGFRISESVVDEILKICGEN